LYVTALLASPHLAPLILGIKWMDPEWLLSEFGSSLIWLSLVIVFIECGLLFPFLPGDTLLFALGLFIAGGDIHILGIETPFVELVVAILMLTTAAVLGNVWPGLWEQLVRGFMVDRAVFLVLAREEIAGPRAGKVDSERDFDLGLRGAQGRVVLRAVSIINNHVLRCIAANALALESAHQFVFADQVPGKGLLPHGVQTLEFLG